MGNQSTLWSASEKAAKADSVWLSMRWKLSAHFFDFVLTTLIVSKIADGDDNAEDLDYRQIIGIATPPKQSQSRQSLFVLELGGYLLGWERGGYNLHCKASQSFSRRRKTSTFPPLLLRVGDSHCIPFIEGFPNPKTGSKLCIAMPK